MNVRFNVLDRQFEMYQDEYECAALRVLKSGVYVLGEEVSKFETAFAEFIGAKYCVGLNSGLDALTLAIRALGIDIGDEVIVPANTYIASVMGITENGATPVFAEPNDAFNIDVDRLEDLITPKTKAILPVHLYGQACNMKELQRLAKKYNLFIVEDCAQSHGARFDGKITGSFGDIGCFSFYPTKNLGCFGDGGAIVTDSFVLAERIRTMRNYGSRTRYKNETYGVNSRLDEIQAALLSVKLRHVDELTADRKRIAHFYLSEISNPKIILPQTTFGADHAYHLFVIRCQTRDDLQTYLLEKGIQTLIHYPIPPHLSDVYSCLGYRGGSFPITELYSSEILSLPLYNCMSDDEVGHVVDMINVY